MLNPQIDWGFNIGAGEETQTLDLFLGKEALYQLSYTRMILFWWLLPDLNWGHKALQASALPTELKSHIGNLIIQEAYVFLVHRLLCSTIFIRALSGQRAKEPHLRTNNYWLSTYFTRVKLFRQVTFSKVGRLYQLNQQVIQIKSFG